jgi:hypothetical protein
MRNLGKLISDPAEIVLDQIEHCQRIVLMRIEAG